MPKRKANKIERNQDPASRLVHRIHTLPRTPATIGVGEPSLKAKGGYVPGQLPDTFNQHGQYKGVNISIEESDTFVFDTAEDMIAAMAGQTGPDHGGVYTYSRSANPTVRYLGEYIAAVEGTPSAYCTGSGMSAITALMMHLCGTGGHVVASETLYGGTTYLLTQFLPEKCNIAVDFVDISDLREVESKIKSNTKVLYFETIANPALIVADIPALSKIAHAKNVKVVVDNTFSTLILSPYLLGADVVVLSMTKYVSGGGDIMAGAICGSVELVDSITALTGSTLLMTGPVLPPKNAFELVGRLPHCPLRVKKQCNRALKLSQRIKTILKPPQKVIYPGLKDHPEHELLEDMLNKGYGYGATFCLDMVTADKAKKLLNHLKTNNFGFLAVSLGYHENLLSAPGAHFSESPKKVKNQRNVLSPGFVRICVGYLGTLTEKWEQFQKAYRVVEGY